MTTPSERIRDLVQKGALPAEDATELLAAVQASKVPSGARLLVDPFERFGALQLCLVGLVAALVGMGVERLGVRFDGFMDLHQTDHPWSLRAAVADTLVAWPLSSFVFWLVSRIAAREGRFVDFLAVVGVARVPSVACALPIALIARAYPIVVATPGEVPAFSARLLGIFVFALLSIGWLLTLAYRGFGTASGLRGGRRIVAFVAAVVFAEAASKLALSFLT